MVDSQQPTRSKNVIALAISLGAVVIASTLGGLASATSAQDYARLQQPSWAPPSWVFGPVWTVLYVMMAVAAWLVWRSGPWAQTRPALTAYGTQLVLNAAWTPLFFGLGWRGIAFAELSVLWLVLVGTVVLFFRRSAVAGWLLIPYLAWSTFALCLNFAVWQLNS
ncbi:TspO/MBR family protein [Mycolicibacterium psychrotolerans]|uniref:Putative TspO/MBR-related protein n=1 Tax=Mycolicibacterium psychrotolerans TaxID=216929 RepID=A0A7I7M5M4_9MYCO|nr:TspO/MBR family protein [Mycolicibacterium psychrotolerans]BBX67162.1 putative TspO/MBR-related protein precursor [Mycolicibacterium psychrotolerans]